MKWARKQTGFTIVELLIVIVVIAILAAITIVSYNGIAKRANNTTQLSTIENLQKSLMNGYTLGATITDRGEPMCLGQVSDYPTTSEFAVGVCAKVEVAGTTIPVSFLATDFSTWTGTSMPSVKMPVTKASATISGNTYVYTARGAWLTSPVSFSKGGAAEVNWVPHVQGQCGVGTSLSGALCQLRIEF